MERKVYKDGVFLGVSTEMKTLVEEHNLDETKGIVVPECNSIMFNERTNVGDVEFIIPSYVFVSENYKRYRDGHLKNLEEFVPLLPKFKTLNIPRELGLGGFMGTSTLFENCIRSHQGSIWVPKIRLVELDENLDGENQAHITLVRTLILKILVEYTMPDKDLSMLVKAVEVAGIDTNRLEDRLKENKSNIDYSMKFECFRNYKY